MQSRLLWAALSLLITVGLSTCVSAETLRYYRREAGLLFLWPDSSKDPVTARKNATGWDLNPSLDQKVWAPYLQTSKNSDIQSLLNALDAPPPDANVANSQSSNSQSSLGRPLKLRATLAVHLPANGTSEASGQLVLMRPEVAQFTFFLVKKSAGADTNWGVANPLLVSRELNSLSSDFVTRMSKVLNIKISPSTKSEKDATDYWKLVLAAMVEQKEDGKPILVSNNNGDSLFWLARPDTQNGTGGSGSTNPNTQESVGSSGSGTRGASSTGATSGGGTPPNRPWYESGRLSVVLFTGCFLFLCGNIWQYRRLRSYKLAGKPKEDEKPAGGEKLKEDEKAGFWKRWLQRSSPEDKTKDVNLEEVVNNLKTEMNTLLNILPGLKHLLEAKIPTPLAPDDKRIADELRRQYTRIPTSYKLGQVDSELSFDDMTRWTLQLPELFNHCDKRLQDVDDRLQASVKQKNDLQESFNDLDAKYKKRDGEYEQLRTQLIQNQATLHSSQQDLKKALDDYKTAVNRIATLEREIGSLKETVGKRDNEIQRLGEVAKLKEAEFKSNTARLNDSHAAELEKIKAASKLALEQNNSAHDQALKAQSEQYKKALERRRIDAEQLLEAEQGTRVALQKSYDLISTGVESYRLYLKDLKDLFAFIRTGEANLPALLASSTIACSIAFLLDHSLLHLALAGSGPEIGVGSIVSASRTDNPTKGSASAATVGSVTSLAMLANLQQICEKFEKQEVFVPALKIIRRLEPNLNMSIQGLVADTNPHDEHQLFQHVVTSMGNQKLQKPFYYAVTDAATVKLAYSSE